MQEFDENEDYYILGIDTSCDDSSICLLDLKGVLLVNRTLSQHKSHEKYQGIVPNIAAGEHLINLAPLLKGILNEFPEAKEKIRYIAVTEGPGLLGSLLVGVNFAYGLAKCLNDQENKKWQVEVLLTDHLVGHLFVNKIKNKINYPFLGLILSGGHSLILLCEGLEKYKIIATTLDDALGECLDKCGRFLKLPYPGGVYIERMAQNGENIVPLPIPMEKQMRSMNAQNLIEFSFSGIKTAVFRLNSNYKVEDICCSLQECLIKSIRNALELVLKKCPIDTLLVGGGVIANQRFRRVLEELPIEVFLPDQGLSTDSAALPASVALEYIRLGKTNLIAFKHPMVYPNILDNNQFYF